MQTPQNEPLKFDPRAYLALFVFRWKIIALSVLLCLLGGVAYVKIVPTEYLTKCGVMIWRDPSLVLSEHGTLWSSTRSHMWLLTGDELRNRCVERLKGKWRERLGGLHKMYLSVSVRPDRAHPAALVISVRSRNGEYAVDYLKVLWEEFLLKQSVLRRDQSGNVARVLEDELKVLEDRIQEAENDVVEFARLNQLDMTSAKGSLEGRYLTALLAHQHRLSTELSLLETQFPMLQNEEATVIRDAGLLMREAGSVTADTEPVLGPRGPEESPGGSVASAAERLLVDTPEIQKWQQDKIELVTLETREKDLLQKFTPEHPEVRSIRAKIQELKDRIRVTTEVTYSRLKDRHKALKMAWQALEGPIRMWKNTYQLAAMKRSGYQHKQLVVERRENMYRGLYTRLQDLRVSEEIKADHFSMIEPPETESAPAWPNPYRIMLVAVVLALGSGFGMAIVVHLFDNRMQTISDVRSVSGLDYLGGVPRWVKPGADLVSRPIVLEEHSSGAIEAYRVLRTSIMAAMDKAGQKVVVFTSAEAKEGKTITVLNLSVMISRIGKKVLLVDMDLRRPRLHRSLAVERSPGVTDALSRGQPLESVVVPTEVPNLFFAPGGSPTDHAAELLQSADLKSFFGRARDEYDCVLVDSSPVLRAADASILSSPDLCSVVFVIRVARTPKPLLRYSLDLLGNAHILGAVMNHIDMNRISSLYYSYQYPNYAYYAYAYAYGYHYDYYADGVRTKAARRPRSLSHLLESVRHSIRRAFLPMD